MTSSSYQIASITRRIRLTEERAEKETYHLELDLSQTDISYKVGDCLAILPYNHPDLVATILSHFPKEQHEDHLICFLTQKANLILLPKVLKEQFGKVDYLTDLLPLPITLEEFCGSLRPLLPRFYSIASSNRHVGNAAHLTVTVNKNPEGYPIPYGMCSDFLCHQAPLNEPIIRLTHHSAPHFHLPSEIKDKPIIMIGPGTGVAPFRGFMQERVMHSATSKNWLFFGEQTRKGHFYYEQDWKSYTNNGQLKLDLAFSRDGNNKVYVQDKMLEQSQLLWKWINQEKAYLYVCGDAKKMAKSVEKTLIYIAEKEGLLSTTDAKAYIKRLRKEKRYLRDVY